SCSFASLMTVCVRSIGLAAASLGPKGRAANTDASSRSRRDASVFMTILLLAIPCRADPMPIVHTCRLFTHFNYPAFAIVRERTLRTDRYQIGSNTPEVHAKMAPCGAA